jgi:hypothetical protein
VMADKSKVDNGRPKSSCIETRVELITPVLFESSVKSRYDLENRQYSLIAKQQSTEACTHSQQPYQTVRLSFGDFWKSGRIVVIFIDDQRMLRLVVGEIVHVFEFSIVYGMSRPTDEWLLSIKESVVRNQKPPKAEVRIRGRWLVIDSPASAGSGDHTLI